MQDEQSIIELCKSKLGSELIGFEDFIDKIVRMRTNATYPHFNIEIIPEGFCLIVAVAGFEKHQLKIKLEGIQLNIFGHKEENNKSYLYKGIALRSFQKSFLLAEGMKVSQVSLNNGLLQIVITKPHTEYVPIDIPIE